MKKTILTAISTLLAAASLNAAVEISTAYTSDYYFRGVQLADSIIEAAIEYSDGDFYLGVWTAQPFAAADDDTLYGNEIDFYGGYVIALSETVALDVGLTAYVYPDLDEGDTATYEGYLGVSFDAPLSPALYVYYDVTLEVLSVEGSLGYSVAIDETSSLDFGVAAGLVSPDEGDSAMYYTASIGYGLSLAENASFSASLNYQDGESELTGGNWDDGFYFSVGLSASF
ncbi:MAG: TorF family putative porin [Puniceicoccaceae bacterium]